MANEDRFKQATINVVAKRAGNRCSNPECGALTIGPTETPAGVVNVGEAAHIYGANPGSARYVATMVPAERSAITNAIWLCGNCHKLVDDDESRYPAGLLFEWQREHERRIAEIIGKAGADLRRRYEDRHLEEFGRLSYLAERIILEKGDLWEYRLTAEALRFEMKPVLRRWDALKRGLYMKANYEVPKDGTALWLRMRMNEVLQITHAFSELMNEEFRRSWGDEGVAGDDALIVATCRLYSGMCLSAVEWEEAVRFAVVHEVFDEVRDLLLGIGGGLVDEAAKLPPYLTELFSGTPEPGVHKFSLSLELPEGWNEAVEAALGRAAEAYVAELQMGF